MSTTILCFDSLCIQLSSKRFPWQSLFIIVASLTPVSFYKCAASQKWNTDSVFAKYVLIYCSIWFYWNIAIIWSKKCHRHLVMALICNKDIARLSIHHKKTHEDVRFKECPSCQPLPCIFQTGGNAGKREAKQGGSKIGPPVYGLCVYAPLLPCARVRVWKSGKRCALVSSPALPAGSWSGSAPGPTLWSGGALRLASTHRRWGDKRGVKIRKSNFMGDKTWPVNQRTSGHVGDHDPCVCPKAGGAVIVLVTSSWNPLSPFYGHQFPPDNDTRF